MKFPVIITCLESCDLNEEFQALAGLIGHTKQKGTKVRKGALLIQLEIKGKGIGTLRSAGSSIFIRGSQIPQKSP